MRREEKTDDQENAEKAYQLLNEFFSKYPDIEGAILAAAMFTRIADNFHDSGVSWEEFKKEINRIPEGYKYLWDED